MDVVNLQGLESFHEVKARPQNNGHLCSHICDKLKHLTLIFMSKKLQHQLYFISLNSLSRVSHVYIYKYIWVHSQKDCHTCKNKNICNFHIS